MHIIILLRVQIREKEIVLVSSREFTGNERFYISELTV